MHRWDGARRSCNAAHPLAMKLALGLDATTTRRRQRRLSGRRLNARVDAIPTHCHVRVIQYGSAPRGWPSWPMQRLQTTAAVSDQPTQPRPPCGLRGGPNMPRRRRRRRRGGTPHARGEPGIRGGLDLRGGIALEWRAKRHFRDEARRHPGPADTRINLFAACRWLPSDDAWRRWHLAPEAGARATAVGALLHDPMASSCRFDSPRRHEVSSALS